jgi:hypothetical protein
VRGITPTCGAHPSASLITRQLPWRVIVFIENLFYTEGMNTAIQPNYQSIDDLCRRISNPAETAGKQQVDETRGKWKLVVGPRSLNTTMMMLIARLGEQSASALHSAETANGGVSPVGDASRMPPWPAVRVLDGGNRFQAYVISRAVRGRLEILNRITISRAFTCYQVRSLLENTPSATHVAETADGGLTPPRLVPAPFVVLDLLSTFYDESVKMWERKRILKVCVNHLERLGRGAVGASRRPPLLVVSVHPPKIQVPEAVELLGMLQEAAGETYFVQAPTPEPEPMKLF